MQTSGPQAVLWRKIIVFISLTIVLTGFFWAHQPLDGEGENAARLGGIALDLIPAALLAVIGGGLGRWVLSRADLNMLSRAERLALEGALGLGLLAWIPLGLGVAGLFRGVALWGALALVGVLAARGIFGWLGDWRQVVVRAARPHGNWNRFLALWIIVLLILGLLPALAPVHAWDALTYHLVGVERYLAEGRITTQTDNFHLGFPQTIEMLFGTAISLFGRETAAAPIHAWFGVLTLLATGGLARRYADAASGWLAMALLMSAFSVWVLLGWPYVDLAVMAYGALLFMALVQWRETGQTHWLVIMGFVGGLGFGVKYTFGLLWVAIAIHMLWHRWRNPVNLMRDGIVVAGVAFLVASPWLLRGLLQYDNPVYPFVFDGVEWDAGRSEAFSDPTRGLADVGKAWQVATLPLSATVFGVEKGGEFAFTSGPWLLTAPLLLFLGWGWLDERARRLSLDALVVSIPLLLFWGFMAATTELGAQTRLMAMALPIAAVTGALGFYSLSKWPRRPLDIYFMLRAFLVITLLIGLVEVVRETSRSEVGRYLLGNASEDRYLQANAGVHILAMRRLDELPQGSTVRLMWEPRSLHCPAHITCHPDITFDHWSRPLRNGSTPDDVFAGWRDAGEDYLLLWIRGLNFRVDEERFEADNSFLDELERHMQPIWEGPLEQYALYTWLDS